MRYLGIVWCPGYGELRNVHPNSKREKHEKREAPSEAGSDVSDQADLDDGHECEQDALDRSVDSSIRAETFVPPLPSWHLKSIPVHGDHLVVEVSPRLSRTDLACGPRRFFQSGCCGQVSYKGMGVR